MLSAAHLAAFSAAFLAMASAIFGVFIARAVWAHDLKFAQRIDEIRSRTESTLRETISTQDETISAQERSIAIYKQRLNER